jgi:Tfp pilus assembly protein PilF
VQLSPDSWEPWNNLGLCYFQKCNYDSSLISFIHALQSDPSQWKPYLNCGTVLLKKKKPKSAIFCLNEAIRIKPTDAMPFLQRGIAYLMRDTLDAARADFASALNFDPELKTAHVLLAQLFEKQGILDSASLHYDAASQIVLADSSLSRRAASIKERLLRYRAASHVTDADLLSSLSTANTPPSTRSAISR